MPLDSRNKRASSIAIKQVFIVLGPTPDGSLAAAADRQQMGREYAGVPSAAPSLGNIMMIWHHHHGR